MTYSLAIGTFGVAEEAAIEVGVMWVKFDLQWLFEARVTKIK